MYANRSYKFHEILQTNYCLITNVYVFLGQTPYLTKFNDYIFSQIAGKLHVEISKLGGAIMDRFADINCSDSEDDEGEEEPLPAAKPLVIRVSLNIGMEGVLRMW